MPGLVPRWVTSNRTELTDSLPSSKLTSNTTSPRLNMTTPLNHSHVYRSLLREFRRSVRPSVAHRPSSQAASFASWPVELTTLTSLLTPSSSQSILPRPKRSQALIGHLRSLVSTLPATSSPTWATKSSEMLEVGKFMTAQRIHRVSPSSYPLACNDPLEGDELIM